MIRQLAHICIHSRDLAATERFYVEGLGMQRWFDFEKENDMIGFYLKISEHTFIEVFQGNPRKVGNIDHLALEVESIDAISSILQKLGYEVTEKRMGADHSWQAWTEDPDGVRIEFHEYTDQSLQLHGGVCKLD